VRATQTLMERPPPDRAAAAWAYLRAQGVTHLFAGSRGGVLDAATLLTMPAAVRPVFHQDDVWVFALLPP
jgi:hypothetical protein